LDCMLAGHCGDCIGTQGGGWAEIAKSKAFHIDPINILHHTSMRRVYVISTRTKEGLGYHNILGLVLLQW